MISEQDECILGDMTDLKVWPGGLRPGWGTGEDGVGDRKGQGGRRVSSPKSGGSRSVGQSFHPSAPLSHRRGGGTLVSPREPQDPALLSQELLVPE